MTLASPIRINYTDAHLRMLVEEYITQQRSAFTLQGVCSYVLYWAIEEGQASQFDNGLFEGDKICRAYCERISSILARIAAEGRISGVGEQYRKVMS